MRSEFAQHRALFTVAALLASAIAAHAQEPSPQSGLGELVGPAGRDALADEALPVRVGERVPPAGRMRRAEGLDVRFQAFEHDHGNGELALGFAYDLVEELGAPPLDEGAPSVELVARGNVAFDDDANPHDLLWTGLALRWGGSRALGVGPATRAELARDLLDPGDDELAALDARRTERLSARSSTGADLHDDPDFRALTERFVENAAGALAPELLWDVELHGALESTQDFSERQVVLGGSFGGRLVSWDPDSALSRRNPFDVPGAALRWLAGDEPFEPSGMAYPTVVAGLDVVDAARDGTRGALTEDDNFLRARFEAQLRSSVARVEDEELFATVAWRLFQEFDAPASVKRADTDAASQLELRLDLPARWSLSYTAGELPLDHDYDSTFALGFTVRF